MGESDQAGASLAPCFLAGTSDEARLFLIWIISMKIDE